MPDEVLRSLDGFGGGNPTPPSLKDDGIDLQLTFFPTCAQHREFLGLNQIFKELTSPCTLVHPSSASCPGALRHAAIILDLPGASDGISRPIVGRRVAIGVKDPSPITGHAIYKDVVRKYAREIGIEASAIVCMGCVQQQRPTPWITMRILRKFKNGLVIPAFPPLGFMTGVQ